jgi:hypothetical protein
METKTPNHLFIFVLLCLAPFFSSCKKNTVSVDTYPPTVVITYPIEGDTLTGPIKVVTATNDNVRVVEVDFFVDSLLVAKVTATPFNFSWNVGFWADGKNHTLYAKASDPAGNIGTSQTVNVVISTAAIAFPEIISPTGNQFFDSTSVVLEWRPVPAAKQYELQVATTDDYASPITSTTIVDTVFTLSNLTYSNFFWRVRAIGPNGNPSQWSTGGSFTRLLSPPIGISPIQGTYVDGSQTTFTWSSVHKAIQYEIDVSSDSLFGSTLFATTTSDTFAQASGLPGVLRLYWRLRSIAPGSVACFWSPVFLFSRIISFMKSYSGQTINSIQQTSDSGYVLGGGSSLSRIKKNGNVVWQKSYSGTITSVKQTPDGGFIFAGTSTSQSAWLVKTDENGGTVWEKTYGSNSSLSSVDIMLDGNYICCGVNGSGWVVKLNTSGDTLWTMLPGVSEINDVDATHDGGALLAGSIKGNQYQNEVSPSWFMKVSSSGTSIWTYSQNQCSPDWYQRGLCVREFPDGSSIALIKSCYQSYDVTEFTPDGLVPWTHGVADANSADQTSACWIQPLQNGNWIVCGDKVYYDAVVLQEFDGSANLLWDKTINTSFVATRIVSCFDGGFLVGGGSGLLKTDSTGDFLQ